MDSPERGEPGNDKAPTAWGTESFESQSTSLMPETSHTSVKEKMIAKAKECTPQRISRHPSSSELASSSSSLVEGEQCLSPKQTFNQADEYHAKGFALRKAGNFIAAIEEYTRALKVNPKHFKALFNRGELRKGRGNG